MTAALLPDRVEVGRWLPHRGDLLLPDRVLQADDRSITGEMDVVDTGFWASGHFPGDPVLPGVLQVELAAQLAGVLIARSLTVDAGLMGALASIRSASFRRPVRPPAVLRAHVIREGGSGRGHVFRFRHTVDGHLVADGRLAVSLVNDPSQIHDRPPEELQ